MKNSTMLFIIVMILVFGGIVIFKGGSASSITSNDGQTVPGQIQKVVLSQNGYNYKDAFAEAGKPISLSSDSSVVGCLRSVVFNLEGKRYSKYLQTPESTLELPALSKGTYPFACSMGMGYGKLIVK